MRAINKSVVAALPILLAGCANYVPLVYEPSIPPSAQASAVPTIWLGSFDDRRKDTRSNEIGANRSFFGNPAYVVVVNEPVQDFVRNAVASGLQVRGMMSNRPDAPLTLTGQVYRLECNQYLRPEAHAEIRITLTDTASRTIIWARTVQRDLFADYTFGSDSVVDLRDLTNRVLQQTVDGGLDSPELAQAVFQVSAAPRLTGSSAR
jgi:hypothetical protein